MIKNWLNICHKLYTIKFHFKCTTSYGKSGFTNNRRPQPLAQNHKGVSQKAHKKRKCGSFVFCVGAELFNTMQKAKFSNAAAGLNEGGFYVTSCKQRTYAQSVYRKTCFILLCFPRICWWVCVFRGGLNTGSGIRRLRFLVALDAGSIFF